MNVVPSPATKRLALAMLKTAREETGADAVLTHLDDLWSDQVPALIGMLLNLAANQPEPSAAPADPLPVVVKIESRRTCRECGKAVRGYLSRGMCPTCYDRARRTGNVSKAPRHAEGRKAEVAHLIEQGCNLTEAAAALSIQPDALYRWCQRTGMQDAYRTLKARGGSKAGGAA